MNKILLLISLLWSFNMIADSREFTVGYFPSTMPRDPIEINAFLEHIAIGQVIETLVKIDIDGNLIPNIAKSWSIKDDGKKYNFLINENIVFSDGKKLTCSDVKYSILRHKDSKSSQSKNYLLNIDEIVCKGDFEIEFKLKDVQVSFLKILTRDHLGIVPNDWEFDAKGVEPWIGSGAYRFLQNDGKLQFIKNVKYRKANEVIIEKWHALKSSNIIEESEKLPVPDLILHIPAHVEKALSAKPKFKAIKFERPMHFIQSSVWWYPLGHNVDDELFKDNVMAIMDEMVLNLNEKNKFELATGVVPRGIQGHITKRLPSPKKAQRFKEIKTIKVTVYSNDYDDFFGTETKKIIEEKFNFKFEITKYDFVDNNPKVVRPDVLIASYAGGFSDPDGFLIVLGSILGVEPGTYLKSAGEIYKKASKEQDWTIRGDQFRKINESLITNLQVVPAWKREMYIGKSSRLVDDATVFSYSLKIERFTPK